MPGNFPTRSSITQLYVRDQSAVRTRVRIKGRQGFAALLTKPGSQLLRERPVGRAVSLARFKTIRTDPFAMIRPGWHKARKELVPCDERLPASADLSAVGTSTDRFCSSDAVLSSALPSAAATVGLLATVRTCGWCSWPVKSQVVSDDGP